MKFENGGFITIVSRLIRFPPMMVGLWTSNTFRIIVVLLVMGIFLSFTKISNECIVLSFTKQVNFFALDDLLVDFYDIFPLLIIY